MKTLYTVSGTMEVEGENGFLTNYLICKRRQLKLNDPHGCCFKDVGSTWLNIYLLLDDDCSVLRCSTAPSVTQVDRLQLTDPEWKRQEANLMEVTCIDMPETSRFAHFGLHRICDVIGDKEPSASTTSSLIACTDMNAFLVRNTEHTSYIYCIDGAKNGIVLMNLPILEGSTVQQISCGKAHGLILDSNGIVYSFGCGSRGELGHSSIESEPEPSRVALFSGVRITRIAAGGWHSAAITECGDLYCWGWNADGQLGLDKRKVLFVPEPTLIEVPNDEPVLDVSCGSRHTLIKTESCIYGCGWNGYSQLGQFSGESSPLHPVHQDCSRFCQILASAFSSVIFEPQS